MYFTRNADKPNKQNVLPLRLMATTIDKNGWAKDYPLSINLEEYSSCHPTMSSDGKVMIFASDRPGGQGGMDLWASRLTNGEWSAPVNLGARVNTPGNEVFPYLDRDQKLYFSSNGHHAGNDLDIFRAKRTGGGATDWDLVRVMPEPINSDADDFAFVRRGNSDTGYFSSNRSGGVGNDDIYAWEFTGEEEAADVPLAVVDKQTGEPLSKTSLTLFPADTELGNWTPRGRIIESIEGDVYMVRVPKGQKIPDGAVGRVFFTDPNGEATIPLDPQQTYKIIAEREGYTIQEFVVTGEDILERRLPIEMQRQLNLPAERETETPPARKPALGPDNIPATLTVIDRADRRPIGSATIDIKNNCTGATSSVTADRNGKYSFAVDCACTYEIISSSADYGTNLTELLPACTERESIELYAPLITTVERSEMENLEIGERFVLENVYYDFDKYFIRSDAAFDLDEVVRVMKKYPNMEIELGSHTDSRGSDRYNQLLSQNRAKAAVAYIVQRGIEQRRIVARGYGESQLTNECRNGSVCSEEQHQENRRTEIRITRR